MAQTVRGRQGEEKFESVNIQKFLRGEYNPVPGTEWKRDETTWHYLQDNYSGLIHPRFMSIYGLSTALTYISKDWMYSKYAREICSRGRTTDLYLRAQTYSNAAERASEVVKGTLRSYGINLL